MKTFNVSSTELGESFRHMFTHKLKVLKSDVFNNNSIQVALNCLRNKTDYV